MSWKVRETNFWPAAVFGFFSGFLLATASGWVELFDRLHYAQYGGGGARADWIESFLYIILLGAPAGLVGGMAASMIVALINWMARRTSSGHGGGR